MAELQLIIFQGCYVVMVKHLYQQSVIAPKATLSTKGGGVIAARALWYLAQLKENLFFPKSQSDPYFMLC